MIHVLFVCLGNIICRSPMAEAVFRHKVKQAGLENEVTIDSAGTSNYHEGALPHEGTRLILDKAGIGYENMKSRPLTRQDLERFDYVLTMDEQNLRNVRRLGSARGTVRPLLEYAPHMGLTEVPDPYLVGGYENVYTLIDAACDGLLAEIRRDHDLP